MYVVSNDDILKMQFSVIWFRLDFRSLVFILAAHEIKELLLLIDTLPDTFLENGRLEHFRRL